jgi:hypothetical protein
MTTPPPAQRQVDPGNPIDALAILRAVIFSPACTLTGDVFAAASASLDTLQAEVMRNQAHDPVTKAGTEGSI